MSDFQATRDDLVDMLVNFVAESTNLGYCNGCRELYFDRSCGTWDCVNGLDCTTCERNSVAEIEAIAEEVACKLWELKQ